MTTITAPAPRTTEATPAAPHHHAVGAHPRTAVRRPITPQMAAAQAAALLAASAARRGPA